MTEKNSVNIAGPVIAIVLIVIAAIAADIWLIPSPEQPAPSIDSTPPEESPAPNAPLPPPDSTAHDVPDTVTWSTYHGAPDLRGATKQTVPEKPVKRWEYFAEGRIDQPPVSEGDNIYFVTTSGLVTALDLRGIKRWSVQLTRPPRGSDPPKNERIDAPIACFSGAVFVGSVSGIVYALDAASGNQRWTFDVNGEVLGTINFHPSSIESEPHRLFVLERGSGTLIALNFDTGQELWRTDPIDRCDGSPAVANGIVAYGSCVSALHIYGAQDGRRIANIELGEDCQVASGPALVGHDIFTGSRTGNFFRAVATGGKIAWTNHQSVKELFTTPAVGDDVVVFGSEDEHLYAVDRNTGNERWRYQASGAPTSPVIAGNTVIVGLDGKLALLRLDTGQEIWNYDVSDGIAAPALIGGMIVVTSEDGTVMAFGPEPDGQGAT